MVMTVWSMLEQSFGQLNEPFHRSEIIGWFPRHYPDVNDATLAPTSRPRCQQLKASQ